ncbi:hypothetical protein Emag_001026 [Eimeria magna]
MTPTAKARMGPPQGAKRPRSRLSVESFSGCCWGPQLPWLLLVFKVLCFCWIFLAKPSCAAVFKTQHQPTMNPSATTWPLNQCLHTPRQCPRLPSASSFPGPLAVTTLHLTAHSLRCTTTTRDSSPQQAAAATAASASVAAVRVSFSPVARGSCLAPFSSNRSSRPLAFCKPSVGVSVYSNRGSFHPSISTQQLCLRPHDGRACEESVHMVRGRWRRGASLLRCLDSSKGSDLSSIPAYLNVSAEEVRGVAASLAFWLGPQAAAKSVQGAPDAQEEHLISSVSEDLAFAWAALSEVGEVHAATSQTRSQRPPSPLPFAALREDVPRLFWRPSKGSNDNVHLPAWNADACECQQSVVTAEGGAPLLPARGQPPSSQAPPFFGRYLAINGFSPSSGPQDSND